MLLAFRVMVATHHAAFREMFFFVKSITSNVFLENSITSNVHSVNRNPGNVIFLLAAPEHILRIVLLRLDS